MGILRKIRKDNFTTVSNDYLQDESLSWKAKGVITFLMSLPDDWNVNISHLTKCSKDGRDAVMSALDEIVDHGYGRKIKTRAKNGTFDNFDFEVADSKMFPPISENPTLEKPTLENPTLLNTKQTKNGKKEYTPKKQNSMFPEMDPDVALHFRDCVFGKDGGKSLFLGKFKKEIELGVDVEYYFNSVKDWSETKTQAKFKRTAKGWIATARNFMRSDKNENKLKMQIVNNKQTNTDAFEYLTGNYE